MATDSSLLKKLTSLELTDWVATFWIIRRRMKIKETFYEAVRVNIDKKLERRLKGYATGQLQGPTWKAIKYSFTNADTDDVILTLAEGDCDFPKVREATGLGFDNPMVKEYQELLSAWAYVLQLSKGKRILYASRKITAATNPKRIISKAASFFENHRLVDVDDKPIFLLDSVFDFYVLDGTVFIANKRGFESAMSFREGIREFGEELLADLSRLQVIKNIALLRKHVGTNYHYLRRLAAIKRAGYYQQATYMARLTQVNTELKWGLTLTEGQIVVEEDKIDLLLTVLNNDRLRSPINNEIFDASVKKTVSP
jgi:Domain of unknown function (DUF4868)